MHPHAEEKVRSKKVDRWAARGFIGWWNQVSPSQPDGLSFSSSSSSSSSSFPALRFI